MDSILQDDLGISMQLAAAIDVISSSKLELYALKVKKLFLLQKANKTQTGGLAGRKWPGVTVNSRRGCKFIPCCKVNWI
jgi:hypothetical protein